MWSPTSIALLGVLSLMGIGLYGLLITRNLIKLVIVLQVLVKMALLALVAAGYATGQVNLGQSLAVTVLVADTVVAGSGLALAVQVRQRLGTLDATQPSELRDYALVSWLILLVSGLPWLGAAAPFFIRAARPRALHTLAVAVSVVSAACAVALLPFATSEVALSLPVGGVFGD